jgi:WD40 repeat protein
VQNGVLLRRLPTIGSCIFAFSKDGSRLAGHDDQTLKLWDTSDWRLLQQVPYLGAVENFSPDGKTLVLQADRSRLRLVDGATLEVLADLEPPNSYHIQNAIFDPTGSSIVQATGRDGIGYIWDLDRLHAALGPMGLDWPHGTAASSRQTVDETLTIVIDPGQLAVE